MRVSQQDEETSKKAAFTRAGGWQQYQHQIPEPTCHKVYRLFLCYPANHRGRTLYMARAWIVSTSHELRAKSMGTKPTMSF
jgi:hypothetical protein